MRMAYLAGPIDQVFNQSRESARVWDELRSRVVHDLTGAGFEVFRPDRAFHTASQSAAIQRVNNAVIDMCQAGVVFLPSGVPTLGTPVEVERMLARRMPVLVVSDVLFSVQLADWADRGAVVCAPDLVAENLMVLARAVTEAQNRPTLRRAAEQLASQLRQGNPAFGPRPLVFEAMREGAVLPSRGYEDDAGLDLYVSEGVVIEPHSFKDVPCGVSVDIPDGYWGMITGRSSTLRRHGLLVSQGVIDAGWTGELFAGVQNLTDRTVGIGAGDRLAQLILLPAPVRDRAPEWGRVPAKARGTNGFGSTG